MHHNMFGAGLLEHVKRRQLEIHDMWDGLDCCFRFGTSYCHKGATRSTDIVRLSDLNTDIFRCPS